KALAQLDAAVALSKSRSLSDLEQQGLVKGFEFTFELAWNMLKDYLEEQGFVDFHGSKSAIRLAFREGLLENGETWLEMVKSRNESSHTYNVDTAHEIVDAILNSYSIEFGKLAATMNRYCEQHIGDRHG
ncbi:MAG: nucleotidyltransferase substrate binding protein, partial [Spirochaetaceae bacterium]|nr:nucleotidyltransferase substrate binding protein [Spirochaetaceae bacterium]